MNDEIGQADKWFSSIEAFFAAHPIAKWLALAWVFGWVLAIIARIVVKMSPWPESVERRIVFLACMVFSGAAAWRMWDGEYPLIVATILGGTSPFVYLGVAELICWKFPSLKPYLSMRKDFAAVVSDDEAAPPAKETP